MNIVGHRMMHTTLACEIGIICPYQLATHFMSSHLLWTDNTFEQESKGPIRPLINSFALDRPFQILKNSGSLYHYLKSMNTHEPKFIEEMKDALLLEKKQLLSELGQISHKKDGNYEATYPDYERDEEANAMEVADFEANNATTEATEKRLQEVDRALQSITNNTYGVTADGEFIPEERLRANPAANTVIKPKA